MRRQINAKWKCEKCGHQWWSTKPGCKVRCPSCGSGIVKIVKNKGVFYP